MLLFSHLQYCLRQLEDMRPVKPTSYDLDEPFHIPAKKRWQIYKSWLKPYEKVLTVGMDELLESYDEIYQRYEKLSDGNTVKLMQTMKVVGMTTTYAARMRDTIEKLKSPIVIVEEAAQVLESHVIAVLNRHCQHLILIGDHVQLRPATCDYDIETKYKLGTLPNNVHDIIVFCFSHSPYHYSYLSIS